jgi:hypothetical protein
MSPAAAAVDEGRAKAAAAAELPEQGGEGPAITPADFAATGLAVLEAEADAAAAAKKSRGGSGGSGGWGGGDRSMSVMTDRTDSGWYDRSYSSMLPSSAVELAGMDQPSGGEGGRIFVVIQHDSILVVFLSLLFFISEDIQLLFHLL